MAAAVFAEKPGSSRRGGVSFLGVPEKEVAGQDFTHHQLLQDYDLRLGNGNNMFISVSSHGDAVSAPRGFRSVMIPTHCELKEWEGLSQAEYVARKQRLTNLLLDYSRRVYPRLGERALVCELATPRTFRTIHKPASQWVASASI